MDKELKEKWVAALRSGKYEQYAPAIDGYRNERSNKFCCLGVLAYCVLDVNKRQFSVRPTFLRHGLTGDVMSELISMNDTGKSFNEIADYIEAKL